MDGTAQCHRAVAVNFHKVIRESQEGKKDRISRKYMTKETKADLHTGRT